MATGVTLGYNFRTVDVNSKAIEELKEVVGAIPVAHNFLTLAQFNEFKEAQVADRKWLVDAVFNLHIKMDEFLMGYYNTVPPPPHVHPDDYDSTEIPDVKRLGYVSP